MYLLVDNFDSFTYNLYALFKNTGVDVEVVKNNEPVKKSFKYKGIILSPGPSSPDNAGNLLEYIKLYKGKIPIFGVCLGMQAIGLFEGYNIRRAKTIQHGKTDKIQPYSESVLFDGIGKSFTGVRYHSLVVDIPVSDPKVKAVSESDGEVMAYEDRENMLFGVQFHPESILSEKGEEIVKNFLNFCQTSQKPLIVDYKKAIKKIVAGEGLSLSESEAVFSLMADGKLSDVEISAVLTALAVKGESVEEVAGALNALEKRKLKVDLNGIKAIDTCGTGGDGKSSFNISTASALTLAAMGIPVVKHGNRAVSGSFGSADILQSFGIEFPSNPEHASEILKKNNFVFLFASYFHPAMKNVAPVRKQLGFPTVFNMLGPLLNPADVPYQIIGVPNLKKAELIAKVVALKDRKRVIVYSSKDGYDEVSTNDITVCFDVKSGEIEKFEINPADFFEPFPVPSANSPEEAELAFMRTVNGSDPLTVKTVALNVALAMKCLGISENLKENFEKANEFLSSGKVYSFIKEIANADNS